MIPANPHVAAMAAYAGASLSPGAVSLAQNESLRSPSPMAIAAAQGAMVSAQLYSDPDWSALRQGLARRHGIDPDGILCGGGSLDLIAALVRAFAGPGRAVLAPEHAYPFFGSAARMAGARFDTAPEVATTVSVDALLTALRPDTALVFVANPGNPTGTCLAAPDLRRLRRELPRNVLLVVDEAYGEFADHLNTPVFDMTDGGGTVVLRTFSKAYGLAGMRVGWGLFPPAIAREMRKVLNPNNVTAAGQAAALAALDDDAYMRETCRLTALLRDGFIRDLRAAGLQADDSHTNFVLIRFADATAAQSADRALRRAGLVLRAQGGAGLPHALRATITGDGALDRVAATLSNWVSGDRP